MSDPVPPGIYFGMSEADYHASPGLSCSGMKKLAVSPLHYWSHCLDPDRPADEPSPAMLLGSAVHRRVLEPARFADCYASFLTKEECPGALDTMDDLKAWLAAHDLPTAAKRKEELVARVLAADPFAPVWERIAADHAERHAGKEMLPQRVAEAVERTAGAVLGDPHAAALFAGGMPEVSFFVTDPDTGTPLKARMDYVRPDMTADLKTFSNTRAKPIARAVAEAIVYENYHLQYALYDRVRRLARSLLAAGEMATDCPDPGFLDAFLACREPRFVFAFVESGRPHEVRLVEMVRSEAAGGHPNLYRHAGDALADDMIDRYATCRRKYSCSPWRSSSPPRALEDHDLPSSIFQ